MELDAFMSQYVNYNVIQFTVNTLFREGLQLIIPNYNYEYENKNNNEDPNQEGYQMIKVAKMSVYMEASKEKWVNHRGT